MLKKALEGSEIIVLAVPSSVILNVVEDIIPHLRPGHVLLDLAKGLAPGKRLISEAIHQMLDENNMHNPLAVLTGPTIAPEAAGGVMTTALVASEDVSVAENLASTLTTPTFILHPASDPVGAELWGAFKNVVALACGLVDGLKKTGSLGGDNLKAAIFNAGFREGCLLLPQLGARAEVAFGPAGLGDLYVTATSPHGRNRRMGEKLGSGLTLEEALEEMVMVAEGVRAARMFRDRVYRHENRCTIRCCTQHSPRQLHRRRRVLPKDGSTFLRVVVLICFECVGYSWQNYPSSNYAFSSGLDSPTLKPLLGRQKKPLRPSNAMKMRSMRESPH